MTLSLNLKGFHARQDMNREFFYQQAHQLLSIPNPSADALYLFQQKDFLTLNPTSPTSSLIRYLYSEDLKGVLSVFYFKTMSVDIGAISDMQYQRLVALKSTDKDQLLKVNVFQIKKVGNDVLGLIDIIRNVQNSCSSIAGFHVETEAHSKANLFAMLNTGIQEKHIQKVDFSDDLMKIFNRNVQFKEIQIRDACSQAQNYLQKVGECISKKTSMSQFQQKAERMGFKKFLGGLLDTFTSVKESGEFIAYQNDDRDRQQPGQFLPQFSICSANDKTDLSRNLQYLKSGLSAIGSLKFLGNKLLPISLNTAVSSGSYGSLGRMIFVCDESIKQKLTNKIDKFIIMYEKCIELIMPGQTASEILQKIKDLQTNAFQEHNINCDFPELNCVSLAGPTICGASFNTELTKLNTNYVFSHRSMSNYVLPQDIPLFIRITGQLEVSGIKFFCSLADTIVAANNPQTSYKSVTSPYHTRSSTSAFLREYFSIFTVESIVHKVVERSNTDHKSKQQEQSESNSEPQDVVPQKSARQLEKEALAKAQEMKDLLRKAVRETQRKRDNQPLLCDTIGQNDIPECFESVNNYPNRIELTTNGFIKGSVPFFIINGRPVPINPDYLHSVQITNEADADIFNIRVRFISPGQVIGRKENHQQLTDYENSVFMKELVLETRNENIANRIKDSLDKLKQEADKKRATTSDTTNVAMAIDLDSKLEKTDKEFLANSEAFKLVKGGLGIALGKNTLGQSLDMRPKIRIKNAAQGSRGELGELSLHENCFKYRLQQGGTNIELAILFRNVRAVFHEKFKDAQHVCVLCFHLFNPVKLHEIMVDKTSQENIAADNNVYDKISFVCSFESTTQLGNQRDRDDHELENVYRKKMQEANGKFSEFLGRMKQTVDEYVQSNGISQNLICRQCKRTKDLIFTASVDMKGLFEVVSYENNYLGCFNSKTSMAINLEDVELGILENFNLSGRIPFQLAFVYKDVRIETYIIRQIQFDYATRIENFLLSKGVYYTEIPDSLQWAEVRKNLNKDREEFDNFVEDGGWINYLDENYSEQEHEEGAPESSDQTEVYEGSKDESDQYEVNNYDSGEDEAVTSEEGSDGYDEDDSVFDWSAEESD